VRHDSSPTAASHLPRYRFALTADIDTTPPPRPGRPLCWRDPPCTQRPLADRPADCPRHARTDLPSHIQMPLPTTADSHIGTSVTHSHADERASATRSRAGSIGAQQPVGKRRVPRLIETRPSGANPEPGERSADHHRRADYRTRRCTGRTRQPSEPLPRVRPSHKGDRSCRIACASARADLPRPARWSDDQTARRKCQYG
jgi:hypothetical protein